MIIRLRDYATGKGKFGFEDGLLIVEQRHADMMEADPDVRFSVTRVSSTGDEPIRYMLANRQR
ncbi:MAG: hypothetical protein WBH00_11580 [Xanthobacteraceae bacterium]